MNNSKIGQYELIIKDLIDTTNINSFNNKKYENQFNNLNNSNNSNNSNNINNSNESNELNDFLDKLNELEEHIENINNKLIAGNYYSKLMDSYIQWINQNREILIKKINDNNLYNFFKFDIEEIGNLIPMEDYYDVPETDKLFSFTLFVGNPENLTYFIGLVYNYVIMKKHFTDYKMRLYVDFHSVFGSPETYNLFNMFIDIINTIDPQYNETLQIIVFFINPFYSINNESIFDSIVYDLDVVKKYYRDVLFNTSSTYIKSPLLNMSIQKGNTSEVKTENLTSESVKIKKAINIDTENLEINYVNINNTNLKSTFSMLSCHISVNLRFLPMNENCEFHVRDLDCRLSLTDKNIIDKFNNPKFQYVPFYVFQFYKFYFPYLKWRIDVNPYLAGCFGGNNKKTVMISKDLQESNAFKILKKEIFFKYILFISFNATNLQIGFLNDEFILANIFEKIKGTFAENVLYLNLGSFANKHVNEYYYALNKSNNYPCILKLGIPIDILRYPLNGKYLSVDPITDFKLGNIPLKYHILVKKLITEQLQIYLGIKTKEVNKLSNRIRTNYKIRLDDEINDELEAALFFSMIPKKYSIENADIFNNESYTIQSYKNDFFSSIGESKNIIKNEKLKSINFMLAGYLLSDVLEEIIFPNNPEFINSNYYISEDNYDRLFNCLYFDENNSKFIHRKINKNDISKKYINQNIIDKVPEKYFEFTDKNQIKNSLNNEFNQYIMASKYYPTLNSYIDKLHFYKYIKVNNYLIKTGLLLFIKDYQSPIYDQNNNIINKINKNDVRRFSYDINKNTKNIEGINVTGNLLRFNLMLLDDENINQLTYHDPNNKSKVNIKLIKSNHLENLANVAYNNNKDYLMIDKL